MKNTLAAILVPLCLLPMLAACLVSDDGFYGALFHAGTGYWGLGLPVVAVGLFLAGVPRASAVVGFLTLWWGSWVLPGHFGSPAEGPGDLRIVTANVLMVNPTIDAALEELLAQDADVLVVQEVSLAWGDALEAVEGYPYRYIQPENASFGIAVLSKHPFTGGPVDLGGVTMIEASLQLDGGPIDIWTVHTLPPRNAKYTAVWADQMRTLASRAKAHDGPLVLAGDLNATRHHPAYKRLLNSGLRDAHAVVGRASAKTWPNGLFMIPELRLDHVLVSEGLDVHRVSEGRGAGSDHRPVVVDLSLASKGLHGLASLSHQGR